MTRTRGLGEVTLRTERKASSVVQTIQEGVSIAPKVHIDDVAPNPRNPQLRAATIDDLVPSVRRRGVLVPVLLTPAREWLSAHPEDAEAVAGKSWVAQDGHRRIAAARIAGRSEIPYQMRGADVDEALIRLHTSKAMRLTPIEEATQYRRLIATEQLTQQAIAEETGVSQSHVAKRLKLLSLPESIQLAVDVSLVEVGEALKLAANDDRELVALVGQEIDNLLRRLPETQDPDGRAATGPAEEETSSKAVAISLPAALRRAMEAREIETGKATAKLQAASLGAEYCENVNGRLGDARFGNQIYTASEVTKAADQKNLLVVPTRSEPSYYLIRRERPAPDDQQKAEARKRKNALEARRKALRIAATAKVSSSTLQEALVVMALTGLALGSQTTALAYDLARQAGLAPAGLGDWTWRKALASVPDSHRAKNAWVIALAAFETHTQPEHLMWDQFHVYYFELLRSVAGHVPTEWEQARLDAITTDEA